MEQIINFIEQYWGYTLVGGITLGTIVTFIVTQIKSLIASAKARAENSTVVSTANDLMVKLSATEQQLQETETKLEESEAARVEESNYSNRVQVATFKAVSYLIMSSKLSNEDKLNIYNEFANLTNTTTEQVTTAATDVETKVAEVNEEAPTVKEQIVETVEKAKSLLDKYK